jgi:predicted butyrate kinase (DUF1464 family)
MWLAYFGPSAAEALQSLATRREILQRISDALTRRRKKATAKLLADFLELYRISSGQIYAPGQYLPRRLPQLKEEVDRTIKDIAKKMREAKRVDFIKRRGLLASVGRNCASICADAFAAPEFLELVQTLAATKATRKRAAAKS